MTRTYTQRQLRPVHTAATGYARWLGVGGSTVLGFATWGITAAQGDPVLGILLGLVLGLVNGVATAWTAYGVVRRAEPKVTPLIAPRNNNGRRLVPQPPPDRPRETPLFRPPAVSSRAPSARVSDVEDLRSRRRQVSGRHADPTEDTAGNLFTPRVEGGIYAPKEVAEGYTPPGYDLPTPDPNRDRSQDAVDCGGRHSDASFRGPVHYDTPTSYDSAPASNDSGSGSCGGGE